MSQVINMLVPIRASFPETHTSGFFLLRVLRKTGGDTTVSLLISRIHDGFLLVDGCEKPELGELVHSPLMCERRR